MAAAHSAGRGGSDLVEAEGMAAKSLLARLDGKGIDPASLFGDIHCLQLMGERKNPDVRKALRRLSDSDNGKLLKVNWNKPGPWALYEWHHRGQALFFDDAGKGVAWRRWSKEIAKTLVDHQESDGHWESPMESSGQTDADGETSKTFKSVRTLEVYSTALCALTLQVYYRRLPSKETK